jgi:hypothetical protein
VEHDLDRHGVGGTVVLSLQRVNVRAAIS